MQFGNSKMIGEGYNPALDIQDFSPYLRRNEQVRGEIADSIKNAGNMMVDYAKERKDLDAKVKSGDFMLKYAEMQYPDQKEQFAALRNEMANPELSKHEQAAMADSITNMIALGTANDRYKQEYNMRSQEFALRQREAGEMSTARNFDIATAKNKQEAEKIVDQTIGPVKLQAAIDMMKKVAPERLKTMPNIEAMSPEMQSQIADAMVLTLPKKQQEIFMEKYPVPGGTLPATYNPTTGKATPISLDLPLPPMDTQDGEVLPPKPGTETTTYQGLPIIPDVSPQEQELKNLEIQKAKQEIQTGETAKTDKSLAAGAAVAKSQRMASLLDQLDKHPGFSGLFGFGMGARMVPGTDAAGAETLFKQIDAMGFIEAIKDMKGMGALSNAEGEKVSAALVGMDPKMPEKEARAKILEIKDQIQIGIQRQQSGKLVNPDGSPMSAPASPVNNSLLNAWQNRPR